jgi:hypothetical protein
VKHSLIVKYILPFIQWYGIMVLIAIVIDYFLHRFHMVSVGRYLGFVGTVVIIVSFYYSLRKRKIIKTGSPKQLLLQHEYLAWAGSVMLLVHAGIHFNALLPWLAIIMLLIVVASGLVGKFLLKISIESLKDKREELITAGFNNSDADKKLFFDSITVELMRNWRIVHLPITIIFGVLAMIHIITIIMFSK